jgi:hypothetical protein
VQQCTKIILKKLSKKISNSNVGKKRSTDFKNKIQKSVLQFDKQINFINEYRSITFAAIENNINESNICLCCKNKRKTVGKFIWLYK